jgi:hypothetical protein
MSSLHPTLRNVMHGLQQTRERNQSLLSKILSHIHLVYRLPKYYKFPSFGVPSWGCYDKRSVRAHNHKTIIVKCPISSCSVLLSGVRSLPSFQIPSSRWSSRVRRVRASYSDARSWTSSIFRGHFNQALAGPGKIVRDINCK